MAAFVTLLFNSNPDDGLGDKNPQSSSISRKSGKTRSVYSTEFLNADGTLARELPKPRLVQIQE